MTTTHINAKYGDFADVILMPGDPMRAKYIAKKFFTNFREVNNVRGMLGYTGYYKNRVMSVMGHGIGIPSCSIYVRELIVDFGVKKIIRVGSCGAVKQELNLRDIIVGIAASTNSKVNRIRFMDNDFSAVADFNMICNVVNVASILNINIHVGSIFSTDLFYTPQHSKKLLSILIKYGILGIEMEAAGIYSIAAELGAKALVICTVSDHVLKKTSLSVLERQNSFDDMIILALESLLI
ncbi:MAG: purine-nucleoside phosphorylase [Candidatus Lightella neohaematopini]|nr:purine-nucleoside phosphorylase [Candidatus Lightella neohaematopini]MCV2531295.1 purine-nucleoside phosphorylase [Candidatus Lightella neohaematopini]